MQQSDFYYQHFLNMFRASLCPSSGEQDVCYCMWCAALVLLDVVGSGCGALRFRVRALWWLMFDNIIDNKHLNVASSLFSFPLHNLLTMHGHRNLKSAVTIFLPSKTHRRTKSHGETDRRGGGTLYKMEQKPAKIEDFIVNHSFHNLFCNNYLFHLPPPLFMSVLFTCT